MRTSVWVGIAVLFVAFGVVAIFSIGWPFILTGFLMLMLLGRRRDVVLPALAWPWLFTLGYVLVAPLGCTSTSGPVPAGADATVPATTTCNAAFFTYRGGESYNPPLMPGVIVGVVLATVGSLAIRWLLRRPRSLPPAE